MVVMAGDVDIAGARDPRPDERHCGTRGSPIGDAVILRTTAKQMVYGKMLA